MTIQSSISPIESFRNSINLQYQQRISADPKFLSKSIAEVIIAAGTQLTAEVARRGVHRIIPEFDFVFAGILTAIAGKYYSMWRVAPTKSVVTAGNETTTSNTPPSSSTTIPTNAFQSFLLDGKTPVTFYQRLMALINPIPSLFRAGIIASFFGYGLTSILISIRALLFPTFVPVTSNVNVLAASVFTGCFMAVASNIRYQILQGIIEPKVIDGWFGWSPEEVRKMMILCVRLANGVWGSMLAIEGMKIFGLQKLK